MDGRAVHRAPLTPDQQRLAESAAAWLRQETMRAPEWLRRAIGAEAIEQEAWFAVCKAAHDFDPERHPGVPFGAFARIGVRKHLMGLRSRTGLKCRVWCSMPLAVDGEHQYDPPDHRREETDPRLRIWCSEENRRQRRTLHWWYRIVLCLRYVESWTLEEVGDFFGVTRERIRQHEEKAVRMMAGARNLDRIRRQVTGAVPE